MCATFVAMTLSLDPIRSKTIAIIGYGNQGRAQALNLRDSDVPVLIGARAGGRGESASREDGFSPLPLEEAARRSDVVMLLLPDEQIPSVYRELAPVFEAQKKTIGFA